MLRYRSAWHTLGARFFGTPHLRMTSKCHSEHMRGISLRSWIEILPPCGRQNDGVSVGDFPLSFHARPTASCHTEPRPMAECEESPPSYSKRWRLYSRLDGDASLRSAWHRLGVRFFGALHLRMTSKCHSERMWGIPGYLFEILHFTSFHSEWQRCHSMRGR